MRLLLVALVVLPLAVPPARADERIDYLAEQLTETKDPRLRAQAALTLGASGSDEAIDPLCGALADKEAMVRAAAAKALGKLGGSADCLEAHRKDPDGTVRAAVDQALAARTKGKSTPRLYVSVGPFKDKKGDLDPEVLQEAEEAVRAKLVEMGVLLAPSDEKKADAEAVLKKHKMKGFGFSVVLESLPDDGLRLAGLCSTYPQRRLLGEVSAKASGGEPSELLELLVPAVLEDAAKTFDWRR